MKDLFYFIIIALLSSGLVVFALKSEVLKKEIESKEVIIKAKDNCIYGLLRELELCEEKKPT
jgi:predicted HTH domain antitoxin